MRNSLPLQAVIVFGLVLGLAGLSCQAVAAPPAPPAPPAPRAAINGPEADFPVVLGQPYAVGSTSYSPSDVMNYDAVGYASIESQDTVGVSAAHHTLPIPSYVEVTSLDSGRTILVRVTQRGPMDSNRLIALSPAAAAQLGIADNASVRVRRVNPPEPERAILRAGGNAPERMPTPKPLLAVLTRRLAPDDSVSLTAAIPAAPSTGPAIAVAAPMPGKLASKLSPAPKSRKSKLATLAPSALAPADNLTYAQPSAGASYVPQPSYSAPPAHTAPAPVTAQVPVAAPAPQTAPQPAPAQPAAVPFHSYLVHPLRRAPDGTVLLPGTDTPTYPADPPYSYTPSYPGTPAYSSNGDLAGSSAPAQTYRQAPAPPPPQVQPQPQPQHQPQFQPQPQQAVRSYLIRPLSRMGTAPTFITTAPYTPAPTSPARPHAKPKPKIAVRKLAAKSARPAKAHMHVAPSDMADAPSQPVPALVASAPSTPGGLLVVQAGAFSVRGRAEQVAAKIGGDVSLAGRNWRVRSGPYTSRTEAEAALAKVKAAGYSEARIQRAD